MWSKLVAARCDWCCWNCLDRTTENNWANWSHSSIDVEILQNLSTQNDHGQTFRSSDEPWQKFRFNLAENFKNVKSLQFRDWKASMFRWKVPPQAHWQKFDHFDLCLPEQKHFEANLDWAFDVEPWWRTKFGSIQTINDKCCCNPRGNVSKAIMITTMMATKPFVDKSACTSTRSAIFPELFSCSSLFQIFGSFPRLDVYFRGFSAKLDD